MSQETPTQTSFETVIGLEVHLQLSTRTKLFCGCVNDFGGEPNSRTCPVCLGLPGALPVLNEAALHYAIKIAVALECQVSAFIKFDRKNYYYPDLPKGYQISQFDHPIARDGILAIPVGDDGSKNIRIHRAHLEEDAGKLIHDNENNCSLADYNRTGTPLMEIVTEPDLRSPQEAYDYLQTLKLNLQYLGVSDCDMEKGSLRCDANISIRPVGETTLGTKTELKNMNSFKAVKTALEYEVERHRRVILSGERIVQQTLLWNDDKQMTIAMRSKEEAHDYRYFPEPDLVPFSIENRLIEDIRQTLPESPAAKFERLIQEYGLSEYDTRILIQDPPLARYFELTAHIYKDTKKLCNWINGPILQEMNSRKIGVDNLNLPPEEFAVLLEKIDDHVLSNLTAKDVLKLVIDSKKKVETVIQENGLAQVSDEGTLDKLVEELVAEHAEIAEHIRNGKESAIGFLVGQAMKKTQGKANPKIIGDIIKRRLLNG